MNKQLLLSAGQKTSKGRKQVNQDFHGVYTPKEPLLSTKGIAVAIADGISSSKVSQIASETAVGDFFEDYYCTSESWSTKASAIKVLSAINTWLYEQSRRSPDRFDKDKGYVCTFSAIIFKSNTAHLFHAGDSRIYRLGNKNLEQLTEDHNHMVEEGVGYLTRALGIHSNIELDYQSVAVEVGDIFVLATDGVYDFVDADIINQEIKKHESELDLAADILVKHAYDAGSTDNLTVQIVRVEQLPEHGIAEVYRQASLLPLPKQLGPRMQFDGYDIIRAIYTSSRSHVYLAQDSDSGEQVVIKVPSRELQENTAYLESMLMEEWIAKRINNAHVLKASQLARKRNFLYLVTEYIEGQTLTQWMIDNPNPELEAVRDIIEQVANGLQAFHRQEMVHQDLRPNNIMIDKAGTVKIIDFGEVRVAGIEEISSTRTDKMVPGTALFSAPEYFLGEVGTARSDIFSLGVIAYQMLSGRFPYGTAVAKSLSKAKQRKLTYQTVLSDEQSTPQWVDQTLQKSVTINPLHRYSEVSEFIYDLRHPNPEFTNKTRPLMERNPVSFWKTVSLVLFIVVIIQQLRISG